MKPATRRLPPEQEQSDTNFGWWVDKPTREDRGTSFSQLPMPSLEKDEPVWIKSAVIITIILVFGVSMLRLFHLI